MQINTTGYLIFGSRELKEIDGISVATCLVRLPTAEDAVSCSAAGPVAADLMSLPDGAFFGMEATPSVIHIGSRLHITFQAASIQRAA